MKYYKTYLTGEKPFTVYTDHKSLQSWRSLTPESPRLNRWIETLQTLSPNIIYRKGKSNGNADALSRTEHQTEVTEDEEDNRWVNTTISNLEIPEDQGIHQHEVVECQIEGPHITVNILTAEQLDPEEAGRVSQNLIQQDTLMQVEETTAHSSEKIAELQEKDPELVPIIHYLRDDILPDDRQQQKTVIAVSEHYTLDHKNKLLYHCAAKRRSATREQESPCQLAVPKDLRDDLLRSYHDSLAGGGHQGTNRVYQAMRQKYFWKTMMRDINCYVGSCLICQQAKRSYGARPAPLHPLPPTAIFSRMHVDILGPLPTSPQGYKFILLFVDSFSKWCEAFPLKKADATTVAKHLYEDIICRYGAPDTLVSDRGQQFMSMLITELSKLFEITRVHTSAYHPQSNAACERMNSTIEKTLRSYIDQEQTRWPYILPSVLMAYRMSPCTESTQFSPYYMLFGKECRRPIDVALLPPANMGKDAAEYMSHLQKRKQVTMELARQNILKAQERYKHQHDKKAKEPSFRPDKSSYGCTVQEH